MATVGWIAKTSELYGWFFQFFFFGLLTAGLLAGVAAVRTRRRSAIRSRAIALSIALPFGCVAYATAVMAARVYGSERGVPHEPTRGDLAICPLTNGYVMTLTPDWSNGYISKGLEEHPDERVAHRYAVTAMQVSGDLVLGRSDLSEKKGLHYFLLDTREGHVDEFGDSTELRTEAARRGVALRFDSPRRFVQRVNHYGLGLWIYVLLLPSGVLLGGGLRRLWLISRRNVPAAL